MNITLKLFLTLLWISTVLTEDGIGDTKYKIDNELLNKLIEETKPHFIETFNNKDQIKKKWIISEAVKDGVEGDLAKYDGDWLIDAPTKHVIIDDYGLVFKQRAKHRAISAPLTKEFVFNDKPFILQYEVLFQDGQECGGGYLKLITGNDNTPMNLKQFHDKTPYTIMFGPDKCGSVNTMHFIFRHKNPLNNSFEEKHSKPVSNRFDEVFSDGKPHLLTLMIFPDNTFKILLDHKVVNEGSLLTDFTPPVNPPAEIDDPTDSMPSDWDEDELIPDSDAVKPDDWDETLPYKIPDPTATKPDNWLDNEPLLIPDPSAEKPDDWDSEIDGDWEAPKVSNPACDETNGCGEWTAPLIKNPDYKGKWVPPLIANPNYKGQWSPRKIPNPDYFEDKNPFLMEKIVAVGFELWSVSANIMFDNLLITDSEEFARKWAEVTFDIKMQAINQNADSVFTQFVAFTNRYPWLWAMYTIVALIVVTIIVYCCFWNIKDNYEHKKTDSPQSDDEPDEQPIASTSTEKQDEDMPKEDTPKQDITEGDSANDKNDDESITNSPDKPKIVKVDDESITNSADKPKIVKVDDESTEAHSTETSL